MAILNLTAYKPAPGASGDANQITNGFGAIEAVVNALTNANIDAAAAIDVTKLTAGSSGQVLTTTAGVPAWGSANAIPAGVVAPYAAAAAPTGWLICDGAGVSRTTYAALFAIVSTTYGAGDGSTTFNLPDMRGRMPVGKGTHADVATIGFTEDGNLTGMAVGNRRPKHKHSVVQPTISAPTIDINTTASSNGPTAVSGRDVAANTSIAALNSAPIATGGTVGPQTGAEPTDCPTYLVVNYIIKT